MKKEKVIYRYCRYEGKHLQAKREISYDVKLISRLVLDEICFNWNKSQLEAAINNAIDSNDKEAFMQLSKAYKYFVWE
jgi:uncharacterized protein YpiB (UPF0302 family)